jgi:hypothetical protein
MSRAASPPAVPIPEEVNAFATAQGVQAEILAVFEMTRQLFPGAAISVEMDEDPEIANERHIVVVAKGVELPVEQAVATEWEWHRSLFQCCPAPLTWVFRLGLDLRS